MLDKLIKGITTVAGVKVVNTTPHGITMTTADQSIVDSVPPCGA